MEPVINYSRARYVLMLAAAFVIAVPMSIYSISKGQAVAIVGGFIGLLVATLCALGALHTLRKDGPALAREGDLLVGNELERPLPISQTTFEIVLAPEKNWYIILRSGDVKKRLYTGGWKLEGHHSVTKAVATQALLDLGLTERVPPKFYLFPPN
jgi:hypothetical protein